MHGKKIVSANEKAAWQRKRPLLQGRIVPTEAKPSKLDGTIIRTPPGGVKEFFGIKSL
jgi:hypothetical protein